MGIAFPLHRAYASTSAQATCTTGWSGRRLTELPGPSGCRQSAPGTYVHQLYGSCRLTGRPGLRKTDDAGTSNSGRAPGYRAGSAGCSATVTYPVLRTNRANSSFVTGCSSIQNPSTVTRWAGASSG